MNSVNQILACGTLVMGYASWLCSNELCTHRKKIWLSCKNRFCTTCGKKATDQWIENQKVLLPDTDWQHITFTMPSVLWPLFKYNRKMMGKLSALAASYIRKRSLNCIYNL